jgi:formamidopyrimidine-DNA glycosylase
MPELPDVEAIRRLIRRRITGRTVQRVRAADEHMLRGRSAASIGRKMNAARISEARRHGKCLFLESRARDACLAFHFGMTGSARVREKGEPRPDGVRFELDLSGGGSLLILSQRRLGFIALARSVESFVESRGWGPDALDDGLTRAAFRRRIRSHDARIKAILMNQSALAGVGNVYADEILFQAGIRPDRTASGLSDEAVDEIRRTMRRVLRTAADRIEGDEPFPDSWLLPRREQGADCPRCGRPLTPTRISGRKTILCRHCQG